MKKVTIKDIQILVCVHFNISRDEMLGPVRTRRIAWPRQMAVVLSRELTNQSLPGIGIRFGGRDHTTVLHSCRVIKIREVEVPWVGETMTWFRLVLAGQVDVFRPPVAPDLREASFIKPPRKIAAAGTLIGELLA